MKLYVKLAIFLIGSSIGGSITWLIYKRKFRKSSISYNLSTPFNISTSNRKYIGYDEKTQKEWKGSFTFIQAADTQFGLIDRYVLKKNEPNWDKEVRLLRLVIQDINKLNPKPKFFIICGDLVDAMPTSPHTVGLRKSQVDDLKLVLRELDSEIKLVCVCGNHDVGDTPTKESLASYKKEFGDDYFSFWYSGVKFIVLNSQLFFEASLVPEHQEEQEKWLNNELKNDKWKHLLIFQHIPWFLRDPNEATHSYFNLEVNKRLKWLEIFNKAGVTKIFCGHYHQNTIGQYKNIEHITTSAVGAQLGEDKHGYRLVEVDENQIIHRYISVTDTVNE